MCCPDGREAVLIQLEPLVRPRATHRSTQKNFGKIKREVSSFRAATQQSNAFLQKLGSERELVSFFFRAQAVEEALRKDRGCPVEKETLKKERRGGKRPRCFAAPSS